MTDVLDISGGGADEFVAFTTGGQEFCIDILSVREIRGWSQPTIIPRAPDYVLGVINLRGAVVPIINLSLRIGMPPALPSERSVIIIVSVADQIMGLLVDAVFDLLSLPAEDRQATPPVAEQASNGFVSAVISVGDRIVRQINPDRLLSQTETVA